MDSNRSLQKFTDLCWEIIAFAIVCFILALPVMVLWNNNIRWIFNLDKMSYGQAMAILWFVNLLKPIQFNRNNSGGK